jgi:hypothetical protein
VLQNLLRIAFWWMLHFTVWADHEMNCADRA